MDAIRARWKQVSQGGASARYGHQCGVYDDKELHVFFGAQQDMLSDVSVFNLGILMTMLVRAESGTWEDKVAELDGEGQRPVSAFALEQVQERFFLFGGLIAGDNQQLLISDQVVQACECECSFWSTTPRLGRSRR
jgi:hypothetical protein